MIKSNLFLENPDLILSGLDLFFMDLARFAYKQKDFDETIFNSDISISYIRGILRNSNVLNDLQLKFKVMKKSFEEFLLKKNVILGFLLFLKGKSQAQLGQYEDGQLNLIQAYNIGKVYLGPTDQLTKKYNNALEKINKIMKDSKDNVNGIYTTEDLDDSHENKELETISSILDETNEHLNNLLKSPKKPRRSSVFKNPPSAVSFFDRKVVKHCGCIDIHEAHMAKIDYGSQKIINKLREVDECTHHDHNHSGASHNSPHNHDKFTDELKHGHSSSHHEQLNEADAHGHHHGHDHSQENEQQQEVFRSFCSSIINKALNRKIKNRHLNNHDLKKIYLESEQNLRRMKNIVDKFSLKATKEPNNKVNILYSPNHFKIYGLENPLIKNKEPTSSVNLSFLEKKLPNIFSVLTPKTPYTKRIPLSRPYSARNNTNVFGLSTEDTPKNEHFMKEGEEARFLETLRPNIELFMSTRPLSKTDRKKSNHHINKNITCTPKQPNCITNECECIPEEKPFRSRNSLNNKLAGKVMKTEDCIITKNLKKSYKRLKSNDDNFLLPQSEKKDSPIRSKRLSKTILKIDSSNNGGSPMSRFETFRAGKRAGDYIRNANSQNNSGSGDMVIIIIIVLLYQIIFIIN